MIHVSKLKIKSIKKRRSHTSIYLRQRVREQTHQVRVWIGKADLQEACTYIQVPEWIPSTAEDAVTSAKLLTLCHKAGLWNQWGAAALRNQETVTVAAYGQSFQAGTDNFATYRNYLQQNRSRHSHDLTTATRPTARDFTFSSSSSRYLCTRSPTTDTGKK